MGQGAKFVLHELFRYIFYTFYRAFQEHFNSCDKDVVTFQNLGRDAFLVVPCPSTQNQASRETLNMYGHLASFMALNRNVTHLHNFWIKVAETFDARISQLSGDKPIWVSTCGTGVYWLHVRLDSRPKYYSYQKYKNFL